MSACSGPTIQLEVGDEALGRTELELPGRGRGAVVLLGVVPAEHTAHEEREPVGELVLDEATGVGQRDRQGVEVAAREVQVVGRLDGLEAEQRDELAALQDEAVADRQHDRAVGLLQVEPVRVPERERVVGTAEDAERVVLLRVEAGGHHEAHAPPVLLGGILLDAELGHVERPALVEIVEAQLVGGVAPRAGEVERVAVLDVGEQLELVPQRLGFLLLLVRRGRALGHGRRRREQGVPQRLRPLLLLLLVRGGGRLGQRRCRRAQSGEHDGNRQPPSPGLGHRTPPCAD